MSLQIVSYQPKYAEAFKSINQWWIEKYFFMEAEDYYALDHPEKNIINKGGFIFIALWNDEPVGVIAMKKMDEAGKSYELAKMGVLPKMQGKRIGQKLCEVVIEKAKEIGADKIFIESNTILTPAITLYKKLGFVELKEYETPYERSNIALEKWL